MEPNEGTTKRLGDIFEVILGGIFLDSNFDNFDGSGQNVNGWHLEPSVNFVKQFLGWDELKNYTFDHVKL